jgi:hypothetical protein
MAQCNTPQWTIRRPGSSGRRRRRCRRGQSSSRNRGFTRSASLAIRATRSIASTRNVTDGSSASSNRNGRTAGAPPNTPSRRGGRSCSPDRRWPRAPRPDPGTRAPVPACPSPPVVVAQLRPRQRVQPVQHATTIPTATGRTPDGAVHRTAACALRTTTSRHHCPNGHCMVVNAPIA